MLNELVWITPSRVFVSFWIALIAGMLLGNYVQLPLEVLYWAVLVWLVILWSGQENTLDFLSATCLGLSAGLLVWQLTGGNSWVHFSYLDQVSSRLVIFRNLVVDKITDALPYQSSSLLSGILFGNVVKLDPQLTQDFRVVGLTHLVAVSGYNLTILTSNIRSLFRPLLGRKANFIALTVIGLFVIMTGAPASILRAAVLACLVLLAETVGRPVRPVYLLIITAGVLAVFQPKIITNIGFLLSFAATYGLMRVAPLMDMALEKVIPITAIRQILSETLSATLVTLPIIVAVFGRLSVVSPISNLLVLPFIPLLMGLGLIGCFGALILPQAGSFLLFITGPILSWVIWVTESLSSWSHAAINTQISTIAAFGICSVIVLASEAFYVSRWGQNILMKHDNDPANL